MLLSLKGGRLHYDVIGADEAPVVCLTHSMTSDGGMWAEQVPALLAAGFRVLRLDMRGHGGSTPISGPCGMADLAGDIAAVLDALGVERAHLVGLSIGGMAALEFAVTWPQRLISLAVCDSSAKTKVDPAFMRQRVASVRALGALDSIADENMERRYSPAFRAAHPQRWSTLRDTFIGTSLDGYAACTEALLAHDVVSRLPALTTPTLVICGSDDAATPPADNREIARLIPGARYEEIAGGRHFPNVEFPDSFNRILLAWLKERP